MSTTWKKAFYSSPLFFLRWGITTNLCRKNRQQGFRDTSSRIIFRVHTLGTEGLSHVLPSLVNQRLDLCFRVADSSAQVFQQIATEECHGFCHKLGLWSGSSRTDCLLVGRRQFNSDLSQPRYTAHLLGCSKIRPWQASANVIAIYQNEAD